MGSCCNCLIRTGIDMNTEQMSAFITWRANHDPRKYPAERDAFEAGWLAAQQSQTIPASDWFDMFMELARAVVAANRLFAVSPTTTKQKVAADAIDALNTHARKHPALQSQDREEIMEMALCESRRLVLRIGQAYRFVPMEGCKTCEEMKAEHDQAYAIDHARRIEGDGE